MNAKNKRGEKEDNTEATMVTILLEGVRSLCEHMKINATEMGGANLFFSF